MITLSGKLVTLRPLSTTDGVELMEAAKDGNLWELTFTSVPESINTQAYISTALSEREIGLSMPFAVVHNATNKVIGSTRYTQIKPIYKRLEIGFTWYAKSFQKTGVNTECKLLLLTYAFEQLKCIAVEFRTHHMNHNSQKAIQRLGAKLDGVLRNHGIDRVGGIRNTMVYSITKEEWPEVKKELEHKLKR